MNARNPAPLTQGGHGADEKYSIANGKVIEAGQTRKEFAYQNGVSVRTVARWLAQSRLRVERTPSGRPIIMGAVQ